WPAVRRSTYHLESGARPAVAALAVRRDDLSQQVASAPVTTDKGEVGCSSQPRPTRSFNYLRMYVGLSRLVLQAAVIRIEVRSKAPPATTCGHYDSRFDSKRGRSAYDPCRFIAARRQHPVVIRFCPRPRALWL